MVRNKRKPLDEEGRIKAERAGGRTTGGEERRGKR